MMEDIATAYERGRADMQAELSDEAWSRRHTNPWPSPIDLNALAATEPQQPAMIIDDWLPAGYATLMAGHGGAGKSNIALQLGACIATGHPFCGLPVETQRVLYLSCEDRRDVLHWRLQRVCDRYSMDMADDLGGRFHLMDLVGVDTILYRHSAMSEIDLTAAYSALADRMRELQIDVLIVDGVSDTFSGNENDRAQVKSFVNALLALVPKTGAVILLAHVNKASAGGVTSEGYSGSTGWHNAVRARWYLYPETERTDEGTEATGDLLLDLQKSNLGRSDHSIRFRWNDDAHLFVGELQAAESEFGRRERDREEQDGIIAALASIRAASDYCPAATQGSRTAHRVLSACAEFPDTLVGPAGRRRFWRQIEHLRRKGVIAEGQYRRANRHTVATLELRDRANTDRATASHSTESNLTHNDAGATAPDASHSAGGYRGCAHTQGSNDD